MEAWIQDNWPLLLGVAVGIAALFVISRQVPRLVAGIPPDYFTHEKRPATSGSGDEKAPSAALKIVRNLLGVVLIVAGIAMLVLPGPGTVTILLGLGMMDFPGKYALEKKIVRRPAVLQSLNETREKSGAPPLQAGTGSQEEQENK